MATPNTDSRSNGVSTVCQFKLVVLGAGAVGKTSLLVRFQSGHFDGNLKATSGVDYMHTSVNIDNIVVKLHIWDIAGHEKIDCEVPMFYRGAQAAIIMYDITSIDTFTEVKSWMMELQRYASPNIVIALLGNKADLVDRREIKLQEAQVYAEENGLLFMETSAMTTMNVTEIFMAIARKLCYGESELTIASENGHLDEVLRLIRERAIVNHNDMDGWSPLMKASEKGHLDVVVTLIGAGADVNHTNKDGWSPLMIASEKGHLDVVVTLIGAGADVNHTNKDRKKARDVAMKNGHENVVEILKASQTKTFSIMAQQLDKQIKQKEQIQRQLDVVKQQKEQMEELSQQKKQTEQQLHDVRKQKEQTEQQLQDVRQQKADMKEQIDVYEKRLQATESMLVNMQQKNKSLKQQLLTIVQQSDTSPITQTANFMEYDPVIHSVSVNSSDDEND